MADVIKSVGTAGGRDYSSLAAAVAALPANLVTADQNWIFELYNDTEFSGNVSLSGHTTDATRCITFRPAAGQGFYDAGTKLSTALRYNQAQGVGIVIPGDFLADGWVIADNYVFIDGLQFHHSGNATTYNLIKWDGNNGRMSRCIVQDSGAQGSGRALVRINGSSGLVNVLGIERNTLQADRAGFQLENDSAYAINCGALRTVTDGGSNRAAYERGYNSPLIRNCWSFGWSKFGRDTTAAAGSGYNATNLAAGNVPGANNQYSLVASDQLESVTANSEDCRLKSTSTIKTLGTRDQTYTADLDMLKAARSTSTPAIGPVEYAAPPAPTITGPSNQTTSPPGTATFSPSYTDSPTSYQWQVNTTPSTGGTWANVSTGTGGTSANYTTAATSLSMNGYRFRVLATNAAGTTTSSEAVLTVADSTVPTLTGQVNVTSITSSGAVLTASASGSDNVAVTGYQYRLNGGSWVDIAGGASTVTLTGLSAVTSFTPEMRAKDAAGNFSTPPIAMSGGGSFTTLAPAGASVTVRFYTDAAGTVPAASLTGLKYAFYEFADPSLFVGTPFLKGASGTTNSNGDMVLDLSGTSLLVGQTGFLVVHSATRFFAGPVTVA